MDRFPRQCAARAEPFVYASRRRALPPVSRAGAGGRVDVYKKTSGIRKRCGSSSAERPSNVVEVTKIALFRSMKHVVLPNSIARKLQGWVFAGSRSGDAGAARSSAIKIL
ncbi:hypothetical protein EVAR_65549_1 [Eumeta japonica]|uniref:Uncharacterized protein n=1 Tax=Eumeta variegata TaxID=151549 RepID=A0A4C1ZUE2_EUMVA|nr:hypothetical protein EVAR_65549_1 [Eumeta japonica]